MQDAEDLQLAAHDRPVEDGVLLVVDAVHVSASVQQVLHHVNVAGDYGQVKQRVALVILAVYQPEWTHRELRLVRAQLGGV